MKIVPAVIGVIKKDDKFLLTFRDEKDKDAGGSEFNRCWNLPGGKVDFGETPEQAIVREMKEEIGVEVQVKKLLPKIFTFFRYHWQGIFACYICEIKNPEQKIILNKEASKYDWFTLEEIKNLKRLPGVYEITALTHDLC